ncbi:adenosine receptor A1-like [Engraulis encrasicolus]|uniref:adenosine receptor A1-like n=1 Tax=Engraulis encrasicolus TaxID=184585 RepID=UPI002FCF28CC
MANEAELVYTVLEVVIAAACCLGNVLVVWALWLCGAMRRQPTFCFIASLAVADFLVGAVAIPVAILVDGHIRATFHGCVALCSVVIVLTQASVHSLLAIALDRFLRVYIPLRYKTLVTEFRAWCVVIGCWIGAFLLGSVPLLGWTNPQSSSSSPSSPPVCQFVVVMSMSYMVFFNFVSCSLVPMLCTSGLYAYIFWRISRQLHSRDVASKHYYRGERSLARSLALVLALFAICLLPMHFVNVAVPRGVTYLAILLSHANSAVNPVVYTFKVPRIQKAYVQIWRSCVLWCSCGGDSKQEQSGSSSDNMDNAVASSDTVKRDMFPNTESSDSRLAD